MVRYILLLVSPLASLWPLAYAFTRPSFVRRRTAEPSSLGFKQVQLLVNGAISHPCRPTASVVCAAEKGGSSADAKDSKHAGGRTIEKLDSSDLPVPFVEAGGTNFIECYADSVATVDGVEYTIGTPCDYSVALCYFDDDDQLTPIELDDEIMDEIFPVAESIIEDEFGEELGLVRTPQTLTLVGELEDEEEDEDRDEDLDEYEEEVEVILAFEHEDKEINLVRLLDPVLLVGKKDEENPSRRLLLSPEEADKVMPALEEIFMDEEEN